MKSVDSNQNVTNWKMNVTFKVKDIICLNLLKLK